jgi:hypothetical protein
VAWSINNAEAPGISPRDRSTSWSIRRIDSS